MTITERMELEMGRRSHLRALVGPDGVLVPQPTSSQEADDQRVLEELHKSALVRGIYDPTGWRQRLLGHPLARLFIVGERLVVRRPR